jgi:Protein of unknown function
MAGRQYQISLETLRKLEESLYADLCQARAPCPQSQDSDANTQPTAAAKCNLPNFLRGRKTRLPRCPRLRKLGFVATAIAGFALLLMAALWWRLSSGPIELDVATPWLRAAIKENFGAEHTVEIGGTQLERNAHGRPSLRIRDIVVRDADGNVVASAPKAEVGISASSLLAGRVRAERLSLVGAEMAVRIERDSKLTVFAGSMKRPFVTAAAVSTPFVTGSTSSRALAPVANADAPATGAARTTSIQDFAALLAWIESLDAGGLDGRDLSEIGLRGGNLSVDDERNGKHWSFTNIDLSITRPKGGGVAVKLGSEQADRPWQLRAALTPGEQGHRVLDVDTHKVSVKDLMFAMRWGEGLYEVDLPLTSRIRADIGPDGIPGMIDGQVVVEKGFIIDVEDPLVRIPIDRAEISLDWDAARHALVMPLQIISGGNRIAVQALIDAPPEANGAWGVKVSGGSILLASAGSPASAPLIINRLRLQLRVNPVTRRVDIEEGELGNAEMGVTLSGGIECAGDDPRVAVSVAGTPMSVEAMKRLWPFFAAPKVRSWVEDHVQAGVVERLEVATNALMSTLKTSGPPIPEEGLAIRIVGHGAELKPIAGLPAIRDADIDLRITGRTATINLGRGHVETAQGRKLSITNGVFEVPDTFPKGPPAKARFRLDGSVPAAAELLATDRLRDYSGAPLDPAASRGTLTAQVTLGLPLKEDLAEGSSTYTINMDVANFAAERMVMGQKIEAAVLKVSANNQGHWIRGDVKINGLPAVLDFRKPREGDAEIRVQATLDESARSKLGFDLGGALAGPVPVKMTGRVTNRDSDSRFAVDADLTHAKVDNLLPGWSKAPGEAAHAIFALVSKSQGTRFEDILIEATNTTVKGAVEVDASGDVVSANFPVFSLSNRDKAALKADRTPDGTLRVTLRGDLYDGRAFVKSALSGPANGKPQPDRDIDLDVKLGTVVGFHGETLRGMDLRLSRRSGIITTFALNAKLGRDTPLLGDLRGRGTNGRQVVFMETNDAGAFFRFTDIYPKVIGGEMWVALDPQSAEKAPQEGTLTVRDFIVRGEATLDRVAAAPSPQSPGSPSPGVEFSRFRVDFTRSLGRFTIRDGLVKGPAVGATVDGYIDYTHNDVRMRGTFVPLYGLNNMFGQIPIVGLFLGGSNEGLIGVTYEVVGPPSAPVLRVNPISAVAPGLLRKFFEFPGGAAGMPQSYAEPAR